MGELVLNLKKIIYKRLKQPTHRFDQHQLKASNINGIQIMGPLPDYYVHWLYNLGLQETFIFCSDHELLALNQIEIKDLFEYPYT